jgi:hypothetical protein
MKKVWIYIIQCPECGARKKIRMEGDNKYLSDILGHFCDTHKDQRMEVLHYYESV